MQGIETFSFSVTLNSVVDVGEKLIFKTDGNKVIQATSIHEPKIQYGEGLKVLFSSHTEALNTTSNSP